MFRLPDAWVWDFWVVDDGERYHLFFLYASRALPEVDMRHRRASVGHAVSTDLMSWDRVVDTLVRSDPPAFDDVATWTGSVVRGDDGTWFMFYTGITAPLPETSHQSIGYATSPDLMTWTKQGPLLEADPRWYEKYDPAKWHEEAFRDPWVFRDPAGQGWHMFITARGTKGSRNDRGVVGHATSPDLRQWTLGPPLSQPGDGFGQLEVMQTAVLDGQPLLLFSCMSGDMGESRARESTGGIWAAPAESVLGPFDLAHAQQLTDRDRYVGRLVRRLDSDEWAFLCFHHDAADGDFVGEIADPLRASWAKGRLVLNRLRLGTCDSHPEGARLR